MPDTLKLYRSAELNNIPALSFPLPETGSMSLQRDDGGGCVVGIDERVLTSHRDLTVHLAHELGHCMTGSFYNRYSPFDLRRKHERRADKWAVQELISEEALDSAVAAGHTELYDLADHFGVTEEFIKKTVCWYTYGNLAAELYF